jgi:hypothetical protein
MKRFLLSVVAATVCGIQFPSGLLADDREDEEHDRWMQAKLVATQQIFAGLTKGDLEAVATSARRMQSVHILEQWLRDTGFEDESEYQGQLNAFEFANKEIIRFAGDDDVEGALGAYLKLSESCVRCHQLIRDAPDEN